MVIDLAYGRGFMGLEIPDGVTATVIRKAHVPVPADPNAVIAEALANPVAADPLEIRLYTAEGELAFQHYFVRRRCEPAVRSLRFAGIAAALPLPLLLRLLRDPALDAVLICPSNPFVSVDPLLNLPGVRAALKACSAPVVAVSPIIAGAAIKGPTAKMMAELGVPATAAQVAAHYGDLLDGFIVDQADAALAARLDLPTVATATVMVTLADRDALARTTLEFLAAL